MKRCYSVIIDEIDVLPKPKDVVECCSMLDLGRFPSFTSIGVKLHNKWSGVRPELFGVSGSTPILINSRNSSEASEFIPNLALV